MSGFNKYIYGIIQFVFLAVIGFNSIGCSPHRGGSSAGADPAVTDSTVGNPTPTPSVSPGPTRTPSGTPAPTSGDKNPHKCRQINEQCFSESFQQPVTTTRAVDVLFVVQTSTAMAPERQAIISGIQSFIAALPANSDFNIAVMLSHGSTSNWSGRLYRAESEPIVLKSTELSTAQIQEHLATKLTQVAQDPDSGGGEEGLFSLFNGITTPSLLSNSQSEGFFRPDAALGVVFVADRRDICANVPVGVPAETDPVKIAARIRDCEGLTPAGLTSRLTTLKGALPLQVSGILYADEPAPAGNELGYGYLDVISLNAGVAIDIANDNIAQGLASIAALSGQQMQIQYEFTLSHTNVDPQRIIVTVNGVGVPYKLEGDKVTILSQIPAGAVVVISYCLKTKPSPHEHHKHFFKCLHKHGHGHWKKERHDHDHDKDKDDDDDRDDDEDHDHDRHHHLGWKGDKGEKDKKWKKDSSRRLFKH